MDNRSAASCKKSIAASSTAGSKKQRKSLYLLEADAALLERVKTSTDIFCFPFNDYTSHWPDAAFLLESDGHLFMAIGEHCGLQYLEMQNLEDRVLEDHADDEDGDDEIDFSMF